MVAQLVNIPIISWIRCCFSFLNIILISAGMFLSVLPGKAIHTEAAVPTKIINNAPGFNNANGLTPFNTIPTPIAIIPRNIPMIDDLSNTVPPHFYPVTPSFYLLYRQYLQGVKLND